MCVTGIILQCSVLQENGLSGCQEAQFVKCLEFLPTLHLDRPLCLYTKEKINGTEKHMIVSGVPLEISL